MNTVRELRRQLQTYAEEQPAPDVHALLDAVDQAHLAERHRQRTRWGSVAAAVLVATGSVVAVQTWQPDAPATPAGTGPSSPVTDPSDASPSTLPPPSPAELDAAFPPYTLGLHRVAVQEIAVSAGIASTVPVHPAVASGPVFAAVGCRGMGVTDPSAIWNLRVTGAPTSSFLLSSRCLPASENQPASPMRLPEPQVDATGELSYELSLPSLLSQERASATVAFYELVDYEDYPTDVRLSYTSTPWRPGPGTEVLQPEEADVSAPGRFEFQVSVSDTTSLEVWAMQRGRLRLSVEGVTLIEEDASPRDPALRDGWWVQWGDSPTLLLPLTRAGLEGLGVAVPEDGAVTLEVQVDGIGDAYWAAAVLGGPGGLDDAATTD